MSKRYPIPAGESTVELNFKNSRFIGRAAYTPSVAEAKAFIEQTKQEYPGYTHAVYAFAIGHDASVTHGMSDAGDGERLAARVLGHCVPYLFDNRHLREKPLESIAILWVC